MANGYSYGGPITYIPLVNNITLKLNSNNGSELSIGGKAINLKVIDFKTLESNYEKPNADSTGMTLNLDSTTNVNINSQQLVTLTMDPTLNYSGNINLSEALEAGAFIKTGPYHIHYYHNAGVPTTLSLRTPIHFGHDTELSDVSVTYMGETSNL